MKYLVKFWNNVKNSRTVMFNVFLGLFGILELNIHLLQSMLGEWYGVVFIAVAMVGYVLRTLTNKSLDDK